MHKPPDTLCRHLSVTLDFLPACSCATSLISLCKIMYLKIKGWDILISEWKGNTWQLLVLSWRKLPTYTCSLLEMWRKLVCVCFCEARGGRRKCVRCWSTAHPPELSLTAVATEGEIWLWPPEMTCSLLHLRAHDVARAPAWGEGSTEGRERCRDKGHPTEGLGGQSLCGLSSLLKPPGYWLPGIPQLAPKPPNSSCTAKPRAMQPYQCG